MSIGGVAALTVTQQLQQALVDTLTTYLPETLPSIGQPTYHVDEQDRVNVSMLTDGGPAIFVFVGEYDVPKSDGLTTGPPGTALELRQYEATIELFDKGPEAEALKTTLMGWWDGATAVLRGHDLIRNWSGGCVPAVSVQRGAQTILNFKDGSSRLMGIQGKADLTAYVVRGGISL